jgi:hypothetical protein
MAIGLLEKYGGLFAGLAALLGAALACALCLSLEWPHINVKAGQSPLLWLVLSASGAAYHFARSGGRQAGGSYTHPLLGAALNAAFLVPLAGLALSIMGLQSEVVLGGAAAAALAFLDSIAVLFVAVMFFAGIGEIRRFLARGAAS